MTAEPICIQPSGTSVRLHYRLSLEEGELIEESADDVLELTTGQGAWHENMEACLYDLKAGDKRHFLILAAEAFGLPDPTAVQTLSRQDFPPGVEPKPGLIISFATPSGDEYPGRILAIEDNQVSVDFNHPLAGHNLQLEVEILSVT